MTSPKHAFGSYGIVALLFFSSAIVSADLSAEFYDETCPDALDIIEDAGCDGSVLLDGATGEKNAVPNKNSLRGFELVDDIKAQLEKACAKVVSCADILAVAARDSVVALGGPTWDVELGRRDGTTTSQDTANSDLPAPTSDLGALTKAFSIKGLTQKDMVALSGAHTIGQARLDATLATSLKPRCPSTDGTGDDNTSPLDPSTSYVFDNFYYKNLLRNKGLLHSDQQLFSGGGSADAQTTAYASGMGAGFFDDFRDAMVKMGGIGVLTGSSGQYYKYNDNKQGIIRSHEAA
uniref:Peroxidase n=1 Tax=Aegilops tauschii TaxID=37682 RepID=M8C0L2_AEGTA